VGLEVVLIQCVSLGWPQVGLMVTGLLCDCAVVGGTVVGGVVGRGE